MKRLHTVKTTMYIFSVLCLQKIRKTTQVLLKTMCAFRAKNKILPFFHRLYFACFINFSYFVLFIFSPEYTFGVNVLNALSLLGKGVIKSGEKWKISL